MAALGTLLAFMSFVTGAVAWQCAKYRHYFSQQPDYIECFWDCCGNSFNRHCCAPIGIIVGAAICGFVVCAAIIVFICCFWRRQRHYGEPRLFQHRRAVMGYREISVAAPAPYPNYPQQEKVPPPAGQFFN